MRPAAELLVLESQVLPHIVSDASTDELERPTVLPGWRVRDVVAHCGAALRKLVAGGELVFTPEANQADVDERASWPMERVIAELFEAYHPAATAIDRAGGAFDGLGLGEWVHGGDVRDALGHDDAYGSAGIELAVPLLIARSVERGAPGALVELGSRRFEFGTGESKGVVRTDPATFVRLCAGRAPDPARYELTGIAAGDLKLFE